jgi:hypothetical protein
MTVSLLAGMTAGEQLMKMTVDVLMNQCEYSLIDISPFCESCLAGGNAGRK